MQAAPFVPVAPGSRGRRGLDAAPTRRLRALKDRYLALKKDPASSPEVRSYANALLAEIHDELSRRRGGKAVTP